MKKTQNSFIKGLFAILVSTLLLLTMNCSSSSDLSFPDPNNPDQDSATIQLLATGVLSGARNELGIYYRAVDVIGRDTYYFEPSDPRYTGELLTGPIDPGGFLTNRPWAARYAVVKNCNLILEKAVEQGNSGASGFAKTMMAHELLMNLNYTDTNGIRTDVGGEVLGPFVDKAAALSFIASQLDSGMSDLGAAGSSFSFSLTSGFNDFATPAAFGQFNRALRARVAAYQEDWQGVLNALSGSFINDASPLDTGYGAYHVFSNNAGDQTNPVFETLGSTIKYHAHPSFKDEAEAGDARFSSKVQMRDSRTYEGLTTDMGVAVYATGETPIAIIRNEELVLLRAEANINLGNLAAAEADINLVRHAAGLGDAHLDSSNAVAQLIHERRYSLFAEGHRWVDMRRWGKLGDLPTDRENDVVIERMPIPQDEI